jgi:Cu/Ag efflux pump CusA
VLTLKFFGATINTMTLGGMAIAIGALVDDAIIDVENVFRRLRENAKLEPSLRQNPIVVTLRASLEIRSSITFATFIIMLVFVPLFFLSGVEGRLLAPLGVAYVVALFASLIVAASVTPVLCSLLLPNSKGVTEGEDSPVVRYLKSAYQRTLAVVIQRSKLIIAVAFALFLATLATLPFMGRAFLPEFNEEH